MRLTLSWGGLKTGMVGGQVPGEYGTVGETRMLQGASEACAVRIAMVAACLGTAYGMRRVCGCARQQMKSNIRIVAEFCLCQPMQIQQDCPPMICVSDTPATAYRKPRCWPAPWTIQCVLECATLAVGEAGTVLKDSITLNDYTSANCSAYDARIHNADSGSTLTCEDSQEHQWVFPIWGPSLASCLVSVMDFRTMATTITKCGICKELSSAQGRTTWHGKCPGDAHAAWLRRASMSGLPSVPSLRDAGAPHVPASAPIAHWAQGTAWARPLGGRWLRPEPADWLTERPPT